MSAVIFKSNYDVSKETYDVSKETYDVSKETYDVSKETYDVSKETYEHSNIQINTSVVYTMHTQNTHPRPTRTATYYTISRREVGGWGRVPFSRNLMSPTPRRKWYSTTGRRAH